MQEIINLRLSEIQEILQSTYLVVNLKFLIFAFIRTEIRHVAYFGHKLGLKFEFIARAVTKLFVNELAVRSHIDQ